MYIDEQKETPTKNLQHKVVIDQRRKIVVTGVERKSYTVFNTCFVLWSSVCGRWD